MTLEAPKSQPEPASAQSCSAFTLIELLVVIAIIDLGGAVVAGDEPRQKKGHRLSEQPAPTEPRDRYAGDHQGLFPARIDSGGRWPTQLFPYYKTTNILKCPSDVPKPFSGESDWRRWPADAANRSYIINGWNDYFQVVLKLGFDRIGGRSMPENAIGKPSDTIVFGEKKGKTTDNGHFYMDFLEGSGNDVDQIQRGRHSVIKAGSKAGGPSYGMADGSARFIKYRGLLYPLNLWAVTDFFRTNRVFSN